MLETSIRKPVNLKVESCLVQEEASGTKGARVELIAKRYVTIRY